MSGPQIPSYPPLIPSSINQASNTSQNLKAFQIQANIINVPYNLNSTTSGTVIFENGTLTGLITSDNIDDVATKQYTDSVPFPMPGGPIDNSIQMNNGTGLFVGYDSLKWSVSNPPTLNLIGSLTNGTIVLNNNLVQNLAEPIAPQSAANKEYVQNTNLAIIDLLTTGSGTTIYLPTSQVINTILRRSFSVSSTLNQDILPTAADIIAAIPGAEIGEAFTFIYNYVNVATTDYAVLVLYGNAASSTATASTNIIPKGDYFYINTADNNINVYPGTIVEFTATIISTTTGSEVVNFYITNYQSLYPNNNQQITQYGLRTDNFFIQNAIFNNAFVIYPLQPTPITYGSSYSYYYSDLQNILILRSGFTENITDELAPLPEFLVNSSSTAFNMSSGTFKFVIQNLSTSSSLTLGSTDLNWTFSSGSARIIPSGYNGLFSATINASGNGTLYTMGILNRSS